MNDRTRTCAILPLKPFDDAKERLATGLDPVQRRTIARAMASDVLTELADCERVDEIVVVSAEPSIAELAGDRVSAILPDARSGHSDAALDGVAWARQHNCDAVLMVPGDCPLIDAPEIDRLIEECGQEGIEVAVIPDRMGTGTNALLLRPVDAIIPAFGPGSRERHLLLGREAGRSTRALEVACLALDLDTADDLLELAERLGHGGHHAFNTEEAIATLLTDRFKLPGGFGR
ncbi:MAG: 2-phospho-L-lactate guanylyltransferase [Actinobacteria bacterium]|nr:2-phospho-L-lactate guanylyltransferase [Actinomycetota bacterium]